MTKTLIVALLLSAGLAACATVNTAPMSLEERFYQNAFYNEEIGAERPLARWDAPFTVYINGATAGDQTRINAVLRQIQVGTGRSASVTTDKSAAIKVHFATDSEWSAVIEQQTTLRRSLGYDIGLEFVCITIPFTDTASGKVAMIAVVIPKRHPERIRAACIAQELGHVTGLMYDAVGRNDTAFGDWAGADHLTEVDVTLLRILYDPRLRPGMTWQEAQPIVHQIVLELEAGKGLQEVSN